MYATCSDTRLSELYFFTFFGHTDTTAADKKPEKIKIFEDRQWDSYSKKELEEACQERGLGKKGAKDDLVMKLISFHQDQAKRIEQNPELVEQSGKAKGGNAKAGKVKSTQPQPWKFRNAL